MIGIITAVPQRGLRIFLDLNGSGRSKQSTNVNCHIEDRETRVSLVFILRIIIEVTHHHLQVTLEESGTKTNQQQGGEHHHKGKGITSQGDTQQQIACEHDNDSRSDHLAKSELVGKHTTEQREEINKHEERTIDCSRNSG